LHQRLYSPGVDDIGAGVGAEEEIVFVAEGAAVIETIVTERG